MDSEFKFIHKIQFHDFDFLLDIIKLFDFLLDVMDPCYP
jgi:hypothetical protein